MKTFNELKESIAAVVPRSHNAKTGPTPQETDKNFSDTRDSEVVDRINVALAHINKLPTSDPRSRVNEIKVILSHAGIDFDHTGVQFQEGVPMTLPVKKWGGRVGMTPEDGHINDDGFGGVPHQLTFNWSKNKGSWTLDSELMRANMM